MSRQDEENFSSSINMSALLKLDLGKAYYPKMIVLDVDPLLAAELLSESVDFQRYLSQRNVDYISNQIVNSWRPISPPIVISDKNKLIDGHHRLVSIVATGCTARLIIWHDVPEEYIDAFDEGKKRNFADHLKIRKVKYSAELAPITRTALWIAWCGGAYRRIDSPIVRSIQNLHKYVNVFGEQMLASSIAIKELEFNHNSCISQSIAVAIHHRVSNKLGIGEATTFMSGLTEGPQKRFETFRESIKRLTFGTQRPRREDQIRLALICYDRWYSDSRNYDIISPEQDVTPRLKDSKILEKLNVVEH